MGGMCGSGQRRLHQSDTGVMRVGTFDDRHGTAGRKPSDILHVASGVGPDDHTLGDSVLPHYTISVVRGRERGRLPAVVYGLHHPTILTA
jgi:hypothetical protein